MHTELALAKPTTSLRKKSNRLRLPMMCLGIGLALFIGLHSPIDGLSEQAMQALGLLAGAICFWIGRVFDDYVVALLMAIGWVALDIVPFETAFATFHSKTWWLMLGAMGLGVGVAQSGLLRRATLLMLKTLPPTYFGQTLALLLTGLISAPAIPSIIAKVTIAAKFVPELVEGMGLRQRSKASAGLFMAMYLGFVMAAPIFLTGSSTNLLLLDMMPAAERQNMTWLGWLQAAALPGMLTLTVMYLLILFFLRPARKVSADKSSIQKKLDELGPLSRAEKITLTVMLVAIFLWITEKMHGLSAVIVALAGLVALLATGVIDKKTLQSDLGWTTLLFLGVILNLGTVFPALDIDTYLGEQVSRLLAPLVYNPYIFMLAMMVITVALRFLVVSVNALMAILLLVLMPVGQEAGISVWILGMAIQCIGQAVFILPYQSAAFTVAAGATKGEAIVPGQAVNGSIACILTIIAAFLVSLPVWGAMGLVG
ncbi:MAG: hypothetical protein GX060_07145 [Firmicutes bacterium]|nr:hypothetical protein [Bacillota bacterium]